MGGITVAEMAEVGELVLLQVEKGIFRPLLVVRTENDRIWGELFLDYEADRGEWLRTRLPCRPWQGQRQFWVKNVEKGPEIGQWKARQTAVPSVLTPKTPVQTVKTGVKR